jgi:hypothetical protein
MDHTNECLMTQMYFERKRTSEEAMDQEADFPAAKGAGYRKAP